MHLADILMYLVSGEWYTAFWPKHPTLEDFEKVHVEHNYLLLLFVPLRCQIQCKFIVWNLLLTFDRNIFQDGRHKMRYFTIHYKFMTKLEF